MTRENATKWLKDMLKNMDLPQEQYQIALDIAIKALQEPCEDCISRAELLKAIDTWDKFGCDADTKLVPYQDHYIPYIHYDDVVKCIKGMPKAEQEPTGWIPVNEKIPIIETDVLLTSWNGKAEYVGWIDAFGKWHADEEEVIEGYEPVAWRELPEPYKESEEI